jgi:hypothetical protein
MPIDAWGFRTLRASGVQNPRHDAGRKSKTGQPQAPLLRTATRPCPRTLARGLTAATAPPSRRAGPRDRRKLRLRRTVVVGARAASQALLSVRELWHGCPLRRVAQTSGSRSHDRHGVIGEMANRSATEVPAIETSAATSAGFPQTQHSRPPPRSPALPLRSTATAATWRLRRALIRWPKAQRGPSDCWAARAAY